MEKNLKKLQQLRDLFSEQTFAQADIFKTDDPTELYKKTINAHNHLRVSDFEKYFIEKPDLAVAWIIPEDYMVVDMDIDQSSIISGSKLAKIQDEIYKKTIDFLVENKAKVIITKTNKGYHVICKNNPYLPTSRKKSGQNYVSYGLLPKIDYKIGTNLQNTFVHMPFVTEYSTNTFIKERDIIYIGVDKLEDLDNPIPILQAPEKTVPFSKGNVKFANVYESTLHKLSPELKAGDGRETLFYNYANRLAELKLTVVEIKECLSFVNLNIIGESLPLNEIDNIMNQISKTVEFETIDRADDIDFEIPTDHKMRSDKKVNEELTKEILSWDSLTIPNQMNRVFYYLSNKQTPFSNNRPDIEKTLANISYNMFNDIVMIGDNCYYKPGHVYKQIGKVELQNVITDRIEAVMGFGYGVRGFVKLMSDMVMKRNVIHSYELHNHIVPDNIINFPNGYYDIYRGIFTPGSLPSEYIAFNEVRTKFLFKEELNPEMVEQVKLYISSISNHNVNIRYNIEDLLGTLLIRDVRKYKSFFILYGKSGDNGKSAFMEIITKVLGDELVSATTMDRVTKNNFALGTMGDDYVTVGGELQETVTQGYELLKSITGGDKMVVEKKGEDGVSKTLGTTMIFSSNYRTKFKNASNDQALNKRVKFINFINNFSIPENIEFDIKLLDNISFQEHFLYYMIECTKNLIDRKFVFRDEFGADDITNAAIDIVDDTEEFIKHLGNPHGFNTNNLYTSYVKQMMSEKKVPIAKATFVERCGTSYNCAIKKVNCLVPSKNGPEKINGLYFKDPNKMNLEEMNYESFAVTSTQITEILRLRQKNYDYSIDGIYEEE